ncbi:MAG TPA: amidohydrolase [Candidatus Polarisedimenticolia bacterium]|nr:amidohydrolase [Candidatus Polarisedimenticolia bacterium]
MMSHAMRSSVVSAAVALALTGPGAAAPPAAPAPKAAGAPAADLIVTNAKVFTADPARPECAAVAILGERIVAAGSRAEIEAWRGPATRVIDAGGRRVVPGFNDAHVHFVTGGMDLDNVDLKDAPTPAEFTKRIAAQVARTPKGEWVQGGNWDEQMWDPATLPDRTLIDRVTGDTPVFLARYDGHMALANSAAIRLAGVTAKTPDPPGGEIVHDASGEPNGLFKDAAMSAIYKVIPPFTRDQRMRAARRALAHAARLGVTSVQDMNPEYADIAVYAELLERGELTARIYAAPPLAGWEDQAKIGLRRAFGSPWLRLGALKGYADGSLGSTTAYFFEPFTDTPGSRGLLSEEMQPLSGMRERMTRADAAGLQLCVHAIGDQAISMILDLFADVAKANGGRDRRCRIEHAQHVAPKDFERFAAQHVIASMQPYHAIDDGRWAEKRIGPERIKTTYAFRTFLDRGVRLAFGTDWSVAPLDPMQSLYAAVTRATLDGKNPGGWVPEQKISIREAVEAYTLGSACAEFQEKEKGSIAPGKLADLVILSDDIFAIDPKTIKNVTVRATIAGGRVVHQAGP